MSRCQCLVCGEVTTKLHEPDYDGHMFDCETCGRFNVVGSVVCRLKKKTIENREESLEKAKRWAKEKIPVIHGQCI